MVNLLQACGNPSSQEFNKSKVASERLQHSQVTNLLRETVISGRLKKVVSSKTSTELVVNAALGKCAVLS